MFNDVAALCSHPTQQIMNYKHQKSLVTNHFHCKQQCFFTNTFIRMTTTTTKNVKTKQTTTA